MNKEPPLSNFDPLAFKAVFPLFAVKENRSLVYFDNAATTQKPRVVIDAISHFYSTVNANANRSGHRLGREATTLVQSVRKKTAKFISAESEKEIVFTSGATESVNIIANGISDFLDKNDEIVLSRAEHHANLVPWQELAGKRDCNLVYVEQDLQSWQQFCHAKTKVLAITAASNSLGLLTNLSYIKKIKKLYPDIIVVVDASQVVAHKEINVADIECDFCVFSAHKMYGPTGLGILYGRQSILSTLKPLRFGGEMIDKVGDINSSYIDGPERFEAGTSPLAAIAGFGACLRFIEGLDRSAIFQYEQGLQQYLYASLEKLIQNEPHFYLVSVRENNVGIVTLASDVFSMADIAFWLDKKNIAVRVGDHCAQPLWRSINIENALRISLAAYNTFNDVDCLIAAVDEFITCYSTVRKDKKISAEIDVASLLPLSTWQKKYKKIIQWAKDHNPEKNIRFNQYLVRGCESNLWLCVNRVDGDLQLIVDSDSDIIKGLALIIIDKIKRSTMNDMSSLSVNTYLAQLGLEKHLSESRINGLTRFVDKILDGHY